MIDFQKMTKNIEQKNHDCFLFSTDCKFKEEKKRMRISVVSEMESLVEKDNFCIKKIHE